MAFASPRGTPGSPSDARRWSSAGLGGESPRTLGGGGSVGYPAGAVSPVLGVQPAGWQRGLRYEGAVVALSPGSPGSAHGSVGMRVVGSSSPKKPASPRRQSAGRGERSYAASMEAMAPPAVTPATLGDDKMRLSELKAQLKAERMELSAVETSLHNLTRKVDNETNKLKAEREVLGRVQHELDTDAPAVHAELVRIMREREKVKAMAEAFRDERAKLEADLDKEERAMSLLRGSA